MEGCGLKDEIDLSALVIEDSGIQFKRKDFELLKGPIVYAFFDDEFPVYVGMSDRGIGRPASRGHHAMGHSDQYDIVRIWACPSKEAALILESFMVGMLKPRLNTRYRTRAFTRVAKDLGVGFSTLRKYWHGLKVTEIEGGTKKRLKSQIRVL